jgi:PAS domain S-box-containing protein
MALTDQHASDTAAPQTLADFIRSRRAQILQEWELRVRTLPVANALDRPTLINHVPDLLDRIAESAYALSQGRVLRPPTHLAEVHAHERLEEGFDLAQVVAEYSMLRDVILGLWEPSSWPATQLIHARALNLVIDHAVSATVSRFTSARDRTLAALDRIATEALESRAVDELLERLLRVFVDTTAAVDTAAILIRKGDRLHVRASFGVSGDDFSLAIGEGFAGRVAAERRPIALEAPAMNEVLRQSLRAKQLRTIYGVPLIDAGNLIGVAHMGSRTANAFSKQDRRLFVAMAARATAAINQHLLREQAEGRAAELRERELEFRMLADNMPQLAWIADGKGTLQWFNQRWYEFTGTSYEDMADSGWKSVPHPDYVDRVVEKITRAFETGEPWEDVFPMRAKDGTYRWFLSRALPVRDESGAIIRWFGTNTDVTVQRFLAQASELFASTLEIGPALQQLAQLAVPELADWCVVDVLDQDKLQRVAIAHADPSKRAVADEWSRRLPPEPKRPPGVTRVLKTGMPVLVEEVTDEYMNDDARRGPYVEMMRALGIRSCIIAPLTARGRTLGTVALVYADTPRRYKQTDVETAVELGRRAGVAIDNARLFTEAQESVRSREEMVAIVSHDLRNPLATVELASTLALQMPDNNPKTERHLQTIQRATGRMRDLLRDLLDTASIQVGRLTIECKPEEASQLMDEVVDSHVELARAKSIELGRDCHVQGVVIECDRSRVAQALGNLIGNAIKFSEQRARVMVRSRVDGSDVRIEISDTGPGISPQDLERIFEPYWSGKRNRVAGTGLGLYICKGIVDAHGGRMHVESTLGEGTTFMVWLPIAKP